MFGLHLRKKLFIFYPLYAVYLFFFPSCEISNAENVDVEIVEGKSVIIAPETPKGAIADDETKVISEEEKTSFANMVIQSLPEWSSKGNCLAN